MKHSIVNRSLSTQIYEELQDSIIKGKLQPGDRIIELDVARQFGVSQAPVREALLKLAEEELVVSHRYKGTFVSKISMTEMEELYNFRSMMEELAITRFFERMTAKDIQILENVYHKMVLAGEKNDLGSLRATDISFHSKIYEVADHKFMSGVWNALASKLNRMWFLTSQIYFINLSEVASIHEPVLNAFKSRDLSGCIKAFHDHVDYEKKQKFLNSTI